MKKADNTIKIVTITGPAGVGKTSIAGKLMKLRPDIDLILSLTSRGPRPTDLFGEYKRNVTEEFSKKENFLWIFSMHGNTYGTLLKSVDESLVIQKPSLMIIIPRAVKKLRNYVEEVRNYKNSVLSVFILPPPEEELRRRMELRGEDTPLINRRIIDCRQWEGDAKRSDIPYVFISNDERDIGIEKAARKILEYLG